MTKVVKLTDKQLKEFIKRDGRPLVKSDFFKVLKKASMPIDTKR